MLPRPANGVTPHKQQGGACRCIRRGSPADRLADRRLPERALGPPRLPTPPPSPAGAIAPAERVDRGSVHLPAVCGSGHRFTGGEERVGDPVIHQQWELPPIMPLIFQYDLVRLRCSCCRKPRLAELPAGVSWSPFAPRLQAHIGVLAGVYRLSRRQVRDVVGEMFGIPISTGAVDAAIMRMSVILKDPWEHLRASIQAASRVHADETGWRLRGAYECLWVATTALAACYRIDPHRTQPGRGQGAARRGVRRVRDLRPVRRLPLARRAPTATVLGARDPPTGRAVRAPRRSPQARQTACAPSRSEARSASGAAGRAVRPVRDGLRDELAFARRSSSCSSSPQPLSACGSSSSVIVDVEDLRLR